MAEFRIQLQHTDPIASVFHISLGELFKMYLWNGQQVSREAAGPNSGAEAKEPLVHMH